MLKKENRLKKDQNFRWVFKHSRPVYIDNLILRASRSNVPDARFGFVISTKTEKLAVRRNALRRALQAAARDNLDRILPGHDIVILVKGSIEYPVERKKVAATFLEGMKKLGVIKSD